MAGLIKSKKKKGTVYTILLSAGEDYKRRKIALGRCTLANARTAKANIENLLQVNRTGGQMAIATQEWLLGIPHKLRRRLELLAVLKPGPQRQTYSVESWCEKYIDMRRNNGSTKPDTIRKLENVSGRLALFFNKVSLAAVTKLEAKNFKDYLTGTVKLSENTARKHIAISRQFFNAAIDDRQITENPFKGQPVSVQPNDARFFYVTLEMAQKVLDACPDAQWRLIFGLARFGGLRCPSEILRLTWGDVDWKKKRFTVHSSKTERHPDGGIRIVPMWPELQPLFQEAYDPFLKNKRILISGESEEANTPCITKYRDSAVNLRTQLIRIIRRAGLKPWEKLFQNLRSTRQTELLKITNWNTKAVCSWIGNSPNIALRHYAQVTEDDMKEAAKVSVMDFEKRSLNKSLNTNAG